MNRMKERPPEFKKVKTEETFQVLPQAWCSRICRNSMNDLCLEECAVRRDTSHFLPAQGLTLDNLPRFPLLETRYMTREEKFTIVTVYLAKIVDRMKGADYEPPAISRPHPYRPRRSRISPAIQIQDLLHAATEATTVYSSGKECKDQDVRPAEVAQPTD